MFEETTNWEALMHKQKLFLSSMFGGPCNYAGKNLRTVHCTVNNGKYPYELHFEAVLENLIDTLKVLRVSKKDIKEVRKIILSMKKDILGMVKDKKGESKKRNSLEILKEVKVHQEVCRESPRVSASADVEGKAPSLEASLRKDLPKFVIVPENGTSDDQGNFRKDLSKDRQAVLVRKRRNQSFSVGRSQRRMLKDTFSQGAADLGSSGSSRSRRSSMVSSLKYSRSRRSSIASSQKYLMKDNHIFSDTDSSHVSNHSILTSRSKEMQVVS